MEAIHALVLSLWAAFEPDHGPLGAPFDNFVIARDAVLVHHGVTLEDYAVHCRQHDCYELIEGYVHH